MSPADSAPAPQSAPRDARLEQLAGWLRRLFGADDFTLTTASADASFRRYFRVHRAGRTFVAMDAPPDKEDIGPFVHVAEMLAAAGINAPRIHERNVTEGFLLLSDLGSRTYLADLERGLNVDALYADAIRALVSMQTGAARFAADLPAYDAALLTRELELFPEWFLGRHLGIAPDPATARDLEEVFAHLVGLALAQPRVFVHRDYHSRNLMICEGPGGANPGVLDFQDAVYGPITYDLVSLLKDCYVAWPPERVAAWMLDYRRQAAAAGLDVGPDEATFARWFDWMGIQRHLKVLGIFARLWHRDGKAGYLKDLPRTLDYVLAASAPYREFAGLSRLLKTARPMLAQAARPA